MGPFVKIQAVDPLYLKWPCDQLSKLDSSSISKNLRKTLSRLLKIFYFNSFLNDIKLNCL